jgi:hypothetical protein
MIIGIFVIPWQMLLWIGLNRPEPTFSLPERRGGGQPIRKERTDPRIAHSSEDHAPNWV